MRLGSLGTYLAPVLTRQVKPRLGFDPQVLRPVDSIARLRAPVLIIAGGADRHATEEEARRLHARARHPEGLWVIPEAGHVDFHRFVPDAYEPRIVEFLGPRLKGQGVSAQSR